MTFYDNDVLDELLVSNAQPTVTLSNCNVYVAFEFYMTIVGRVGVFTGR